MNRHRTKPKVCAFTLIEVAVIVVLLSGLASLWVTAALKNSRQIKRVQCAANLQQFTLAMHILANENDDKFPTNNVGYWPWDIPPAVGTFVESTGCKWTVMYCPGTAPRLSQADNFQFYNYSPAYRVLGYANTLPGTRDLVATNQNPTLSPVPIQISFLVFVTPVSSERVLLADATISSYGQNNDALRDTYNYTQITGGYPWAHLSPHLSGKLPAGGNVGMLDGHVAWRQFKDMRVRTTSGSPGFWW